MFARVRLRGTTAGCRPLYQKSEQRQGWPMSRRGPCDETRSAFRRRAFRAGSACDAAALAAAPRFGARRPGRPVTKLPLPRYASLKTDRVNLREGPSKDHPTKWVYERAGLPVEITAEFEIWRKVRDSEGVEGWVLHSLLSGRRTALVAEQDRREFKSTPAPPRAGTSPRRSSPASSSTSATATAPGA